MITKRSYSKINKFKNIELRYSNELEYFLKSGDKEVLNSNTWDEAAFEKLIERTYAFFPETNDQEIILNFTHHRHYLNKVIASMYPPNFPVNEDDPSDTAELRKLKPNAFIIHRWRNIFSLDEIAKTVNLSHEFQHISQYINKKDHYLRSRIIHHLVGGIQEDCLPTEIDAERYSKLVIEKIYGKGKTDNWIIAQLEDRPHVFFMRFKNIDLGKEYNMKQEVMNLWKIYRLDKQIEKIQRETKRSDDQERILNMYHKVKVSVG